MTIVLLMITSQSWGTLSFTLHLEPFNQGMYVRDIYGGWRWYNQSTAIGLKWGIPLGFSETAVLSSRFLLDGFSNELCVVGNAMSVCLNGANGAISLNYELSVFWVSGVTQDYGYAMNASPSHRMWLTLDVPILK